jgi:hypothetical protein
VLSRTIGILLAFYVLRVDPSPRNSLDALLDSLGADGKDFELLCKWYLENEPLWKSIFKKVALGRLARALGPRPRD